MPLENVSSKPPLTADNNNVIKYKIFSILIFIKFQNFIIKDENDNIYKVYSLHNNFLFNQESSIHKNRPVNEDEVNAFNVIFDIFWRWIFISDIVFFYIKNEQDEIIQENSTSTVI